MLKISVSDFQKALEQLLIHYDISDEDAKIIVATLLEGDLCGYHKHGTERLLQILDGFQQKTLDPASKPQILKESAAITILDASFCVGHPIAHRAMALAIDKSKKCGIGLTGVINAGHIGMLSYYTKIAAEQDCFGLAMCTSSPITVVTGGKTKTFGTNPIAYSYPTHTSSITADFSTSKVSRSTLKEQVMLKAETPEIWGVDEDGIDTLSPEKILKGGLKTFSGNIKGDMISMMISVLAGPLLGTKCNPNIIGSSDTKKPSNTGNLFIAFNLDSFSDVNFFKDQCDYLVNFINSQKADFRIPGLKAEKNKQTALCEGLFLTDKMIALFKKHNVEY